MIFTKWIIYRKTTVYDTQFSPDARKEVLKRLLKLNHEIHEHEAKAGLHIKGKTKKKQKADASKQIRLF